MRARVLYLCISVLILASMMLSACQTATPTATVEPTVAATEVVLQDPTKPVDCAYGGEIKSIEAVDAYTVKFTLCYSDPAFAFKAAFSTLAIQDSDYLDANTGDSIKMSETPNGTGPYKVVEWKRGDSVTLQANPDFWGEKAKVETLIFRWSEQSAQRLLELQSGTVDGIDNPAPEDFETIANDSKLAIYPRADALNIFYVAFNNTFKPFDDVRVRKAFALAIDRQRIVDNYLPKGSSVAQNFVPPAVFPGYSEDEKWFETGTAAAREEAKALLADAGFADGMEVTLTIRNVVRAYLPSPDKVAQEIQAQLKEIGVTVKIEEMESTTFLDATSNGQVAFCLLGWNGDYADATNFYDYHFANENNKTFGNVYPEISTEIKAAAQVEDADVRQEHYKKVNTLLKELVPMLPVSHGSSATAFKAEVVGAHSSPLGAENFSVMDNGKDQLVFMQNGEPGAIWCSDETDGEALRVCEQIYEPLLSFEVAGTKVIPALAESYSANEDATEWTFKLRQGVKFHNGADFDSKDVLATYIAQWDAASPNHVGRTGSFEYWGSFFGPFLNAGQ